MNKKNKIISVSMTEAEINTLRDLAESQHVTVSWLIRSWIRMLGKKLSPSNDNQQQ